MSTTLNAAGRIEGGTVLSGGSLASRAIGWHDGRVASKRSLRELPASTPTIDATGCLVLAGIVDLHGDSFERSLMPRPGVKFDLDIALDDNESQLLAAGITTSFLALTDSWEPGLRSRATMLQVVDALSRRRGQRSGPRVEVHVRHERCMTRDLDELIAVIEHGDVRMVSFGDHTPGGIALVKGLSGTQVARTGVSLERLEELQSAAMANRPLGKQHERHLAAICDQNACPTASHDSSTAADLQRDLRLGVGIAEFPTSIELAREYQAEDIAVMLGAPNLVRGGSHLGNLDVSDAWAAGVCDFLVSDYHYPSLLQAPFELERLGLSSLAAAWAAVSSTPARVAKLDDRGDLTAGKLADIIVVEPPAEIDGRRLPARVRAAVVGGTVVAGRTA